MMSSDRIKYLTEVSESQLWLDSRQKDSPVEERQIRKRASGTKIPNYSAVKMQTMRLIEEVL